MVGENTGTKTHTEIGKNKLCIHIIKILKLRKNKIRILKQGILHSCDSLASNYFKYFKNQCNFFFVSDGY